MAFEVPKPAARLLLVEDEHNLATPLRFNLEQEGYDVSWTASGREALALQEAERYDLLILDVMIEEIDGFEVARQVRQRDPKIPILMLTARSASSDRIQGLEIGADDYLVKPFHMKELLLRVRRMLERADWYTDTRERSSEVLVGRHPVNLETLVGSGPHGKLQLTALEARLLGVLTAEPNRVISRGELLERVWGYTSDVETRTVDNFMSRLRKYFEDEPDQPKHFVSVRGRGYMYVP